MVPVGKAIQQGNNVFRISLVQRLSVADPSRHGFQYVEGSENVSVFFFQHVANSHDSPPLIPGTARTMPQNTRYLSDISTPHLDRYLSDCRYPAVFLSRQLRSVSVSKARSRFSPRSF